MRKIHALVLIMALWSALPGHSPLRALFAPVGEDLTSGTVVATSDPDTDPFMISIPPPR